MRGSSVSTLDPSVLSSKVPGFLNSRVLLEFWALGISGSRNLRFQALRILWVKLSEDSDFPEFLDSVVRSIMTSKLHLHGTHPTCPLAYPPPAPTLQSPAPSSDPRVGGGYILQIIGKDVLTSTYGATAETLSTSTTTHVTKVSSSRVSYAPSLAAGLRKVTAIAQPWEHLGHSQVWSAVLLVLSYGLPWVWPCSSTLTARLRGRAYLLGSYCEP